MREILKGIRLPSAAAPGCFDSRVHHVIWAGDLNYRIEVPNAETLEEQNLKVSIVAQRTHASPLVTPLP